MSNENKDIQPFQIELEPLGAPEPQELSLEGDVPYAPQIDRPTFSPVPSTQAHYCPQCNYDLRGLTTRVCPECGRAFTIAETRKERGSRSPVSKEDESAMRIERFCFWGGIAMLLVFTFVPVLIFSKPGNLWGFFMSGSAAIACMIGVVFKVIFERTWSEAIFVTGGGFAVYSTVVMVMTI